MLPLHLYEPCDIINTHLFESKIMIHPTKKRPHLRDWSFFCLSPPFTLCPTVLHCEISSGLLVRGVEGVCSQYEPVKKPE
jgi:hypothetical protein